MSKFFASLLMIAFLIFMGLMVQSEWGWSLVLWATSALASASVSLVMLQFPAGVTWTQVQLVWKGQLHQPEKLVQELYDLASVVRRDGLLGAENIRKNIKDEKLHYLTKRLMDGYEKKNILQWIHNQRDFEGFWIQQVHQLQERFLSVIPSVGIFMVLGMLIYFFVAGEMSSVRLGIGILPFGLSIALQLLVNAVSIDPIHSAKVSSICYFRILEEGLMGISEGINAEFLREQLIARLGMIQKKVE